MRDIAIVDDDPAERLVIRGMVEESGLSVVAEGADGASAVEICSSKRPDLIIIDVTMPAQDGPIHDGIDAAEEIKRRSPTPVVLLTASDDEETVRRAARAGVMAYLVKPIRLEEIRPAVELAISRFADLKAVSEENADLKNTLEQRKLIEKAKGLLMEKEGLSENAAFARLRKISMDKRTSMAEIAGVIIQALDDLPG